MRSLQYIYNKVLAIALIMFATTNAMADDSIRTVNRFDSVEISLLTCEPHNKVYSLYGHTAIRINDKVTGEDLAVNYGVFNSRKKNFVLRFIFGLTDYEVGIYPFSSFLQEYEQDGRSVTEQVLNLTADEKQAIIQDIAINAMPENKVYRYNIFYNNCTTKARDVILKHLKENVEFSERGNRHSFREMTHKYTKNHRWAQFGNDMLLGVKADDETTQEEQQFLPERLMHDFNDARLVDDNQKKTYLVKKTNTILPSGGKEAVSEFPLPPIAVCSIIGLAIIILTIIERSKGKYFWLLDAIICLSFGLVGILLTAMMFSQHPTVQLNLQWMMFNPLPLIFGWKAICMRRKGKEHWLWITWNLMIVGLIFGSFFQHYAEGITALALSLLLRDMIRNIRIGKNKLKITSK